jgi:outer membrane protein assembly factor BamB
VDGKDIEIVTKGSGNLLFKIDRDGWILNYGVENNPISDIWSSSVTLDDDGNIYFTGGDFTSTYAYVTKLAPNGNVIWQKQLNSYSTGESIVYKNGHLYILMQDFSYFPFYGNMMVCKIGIEGDMKNLWVLDVSSFESPAYNVPYGYEITVDDNENIYYVGTQKNFTNGNDLIMGKFNTSNSNVEWQNYISGGLGFSNTVMDRGISIKYKDGHVYVTGTIQNNGHDIVFRNDRINKYCGIL